MTTAGGLPRPLHGRPHGQPHGRPLGLAVLALHLGLGLALHHLLRPAPRSPVANPPVHVWITRLAPEPAPQRPAGPGETRRKAAARPAVMPREAARPTAPQAIHLPAVPADATAPAAPPIAEAGAARPAAPAPPAPLNLALPGRPASAPPAQAGARNDPRVHDAPLDGDQRMARALGTNTTLRTVRRGDGFELRRGTDCAQVQPTRAGQILPADTSAARPALVGKC